jgi:hypothetical protein
MEIKMLPALSDSNETSVRDLIKRWVCANFAFFDFRSCWAAFFKLQIQESELIAGTMNGVNKLDCAQCSLNSR